jgi:two-component system chemotaxis sensor kinase CheA
MSDRSRLDADFIAQALPAFISEAHEQIETLEHLLLELESAPDDRSLLDALFRCMHTVKGSAGIFGLDDVVSFTHHVETLLDRLREGRLAVTPGLSTLLLQSNDQVRRLVAAAQGDAEASAEALAAGDALVQRLRFACDPEGVPAASRTGAQEPLDAVGAQAEPADQPWKVTARFRPDALRNGMDPLAILTYLRTLGTVEGVRLDTQAVPPLDVLDPETCHAVVQFAFAGAKGRQAIDAAFSFAHEDCDLQIGAAEPAPVDGPAAMTPAPALASAAAAPVMSSRAPAPAAASRAAAEPGTRPAEESRFIRVQADRLDEVINLLGELVIAGAGASMLARQSRHGALMEANQQVARLIEDIRNSTLQLRMVPIGETFSRFRRVVRDTAAELGKDVALEIVGGETELDKSVVERIADPLMHLVRNGLDHGLESPAEREAAGKPAQGTLTLAACHESGNIVIRITDDGRGIQRDKVLARAIERGLVDAAAPPEGADILNLIFEPGFSTAEKVTNLSGRGVGMDVVRSNIEALRGSVTLASEAGQGSTIEIRLPLTLAIIDGFLVGVGPSRFIFPLESVVEVIAEAGEGVLAEAGGRGCVELRGQVLPVMDLRQVYGLDSPRPLRGSIVVVRSGASRYGVLVDALLGQHQTVIKPLGRLLGSLRGMSGSSILGTGEVALIFDVPSLAHLASHPPATVSTASRTVREPHQPVNRLQPESQAS